MRKMNLVIEMGSRRSDVFMGHGQTGGKRSKNYINTDTIRKKEVKGDC